jgi:hypothetical protein
MKSLMFILLLPLLVMCSGNRSGEKAFSTKYSDITIVTDENLSAPSISNGYYGYVVELKGNFMPGIDGSSGGMIDSVQKEVFVYNKLTFDDLKNARTEMYSSFWFIDSISSAPVAIIRPNTNGFYQLKLPPGNYTGLIKIDETRLYNNLSIGDGHVGPLIFEADTLVKLNFKIDFEAGY